MATQPSPSSRKVDFGKVLPSKVPTVRAPTVENLAPSQGQSWSNYWTVISGLILVMFVVYLAANGLLQQWLQLFTYTPPQQTQSPSPASILGNATTAILGGPGQMITNVWGQALGGLQKLYGSK